MKPSFPNLQRRSPFRPLAAIAAVLLAATMAACTLSRPAPVKHTYLLEATPPPVANVAKLATIRIGVISVAAPFRGRSLVYRRDDITYESDFYSEFFVAPSAMLSEATAKALTASGAFRRVIPPGAAGAVVARVPAARARGRRDARCTRPRLEHRAVGAARRSRARPRRGRPAETLKSGSDTIFG